MIVFSDGEEPVLDARKNRKRTSRGELKEPRSKKSKKKKVCFAMKLHLL